MDKKSIRASIPMRQLMVECLTGGNPIEISMRMDKSVQTISDQLNVLFKLGYMTRNKIGRTVTYTTNIEAVYGELVNLSKNEEYIGVVPKMDEFINLYLCNKALKNFSLNQIMQLYLSEKPKEG